ncbi:tetratricopeptide repeat protein [Polaromonas sp.]|uniref:O-linked N-acetylglucosamine transferase, SPINDLY family protein n=1 Tax=Polaromonas sp. TaxID=1869339 RepID=UPI00326723A7
MLKWLATKFEARRAGLQSRLEGSLQPSMGTSQQISSAEWRKRGNAHLDAGRLNEAAECYRSGMAISPDDAICYSNLGYVLGEQGRSTESQEMLLKAVKLNPADFDAYYLLGNLARARGELLQAVVSYRRALDIRPDFDICRRGLCVLLAQTGRTREARLVLEQGPAFPENTVDFYYFRGNLHLAEDELDDAIKNFLRAAHLQPRDSSILINLGVAQLRKRDVFSAIDTYRGILEFEPGNVQAHANIAAAFQLSGQLDLAIQSYRHALKINPEYLNAHQNLLYALTYVPDFPPAEYLLEARRYGTRITARAKAYSRWLCPALTEVARPLRVGFISGDLRTHPVGLFLESILARIDPAKLTLVAYSNSTTVDVLSERLRAQFAEWNLVSAMPDEALARKIHGDSIDILVDLSGHTEFNRLPVFAWKAAPLQASWLGYWASTGVEEIDYILVDDIAVPKSEVQFFSEKIWYLPDTRFCLSPPATAQPVEIQELPALRNGRITFGSFQILNKISDRTLALWARILARAPSARFRLQSLPLSYPEAIANMRRRLAAVNIDPDQVDLHGGVSREDYLASYSEVDIVLDTFPFPGGTTTAEALWMGVPTVTLTGSSLLARQGESLLRCVGLGDWVAANEQEYVDIALAKVGDLKKLGELRATLRSRALNSPLFDAARFARHLEDAFTGMACAKILRN